MVSDELVGEKILPITSPKAVGSTDAGKEAEVEEVEAAPAPPPKLFLTMNAKIYSLERFQEDFVDVSVKEVDLLNEELEVSKLYHCDGLVLCVGKDKKDEDPKLVLWNPHLCQTRLIAPRESFNVKDRHAIGYDDSRNHKILRFVDDYTLPPERKHEVGYEIYEIKSNSWRVLEVVKDDPKWSIDLDQRGVSVKGHTYFFAHHLVPNGYGGCKEEIFLLCFDFTKERFGPQRLPLPFNDYYSAFNGDVVTLSSTFFRRGGGDDDDEQLAVLVGGFESGFFEIWVTLTVDPSRASWSKFLRMEPGPFADYGFRLYPSRCGGSFFVDEENKVAVLFELFQLGGTKTFHKAFVFGQDGCFKSKSSVNLGEALILENRNPFFNNICKAARHPLVCSSSYRPSLVQVKLNDPSNQNPLQSDIDDDATRSRSLEGESEHSHKRMKTL